MKIGPPGNFARPAFPRSLAARLSLFFLMSMLTALTADQLQFSKLASLPDPEGFAGAFAGVAKDRLIVAGGANFPEKKPWEGGAKVWHDGVFSLDDPQAQWKRIGKLPRALGYGIAVTTREGIVCVGGSDAERHHREVFLLEMRDGQLEFKDLPALPIPVANGAGALLEGTILVFGGSDQPGETSALNRLFAYDLKAAASEWRELEACPGPGRFLPAAAVVNGVFYVMGGAGLEAKNGQAIRAYLHDAWSYRPGEGWRRCADLPRPVVAAPSPAPVNNGQIYLIGGDDGARKDFQPVSRHPGFAKSILQYNAKADAWSSAGETPAPRAVLPAVLWRGRWIMPNGEARPGVRSPEVWSFSPAGRPAS